MEVVLFSSHASLIFNPRRNPNLSPKMHTSLPGRILKSRLQSSVLCITEDVNNWPRSCKPIFYLVGYYRRRFFCQPLQRLDKMITLQCGLFSVRNGRLPKLRNYGIGLQKAVRCSEKLKNHASVLFFHLIVGMVLVMTVSVAVSRTPSYALTEENLLFLEAWRTIDRAYVDKTFNGQSWFRYRENALRTEPMNTRQETCMLLVTRGHTMQSGKCWPPWMIHSRVSWNLKSSKVCGQSGTQGSVTGVGLSIGYPTGGDGSHGGLVVISASPAGPANKAGILSGDVILKIGDTSTESMGIYDAAERLQGPEGSEVDLTIQSGPEIKHLSLTREKISLNPVQAKLCEVPGLGRENSRVGYIKLTSFNQNASVQRKPVLPPEASSQKVPSMGMGSAVILQNMANITPVMLEQKERNAKENAVRFVDNLGIHSGDCNLRLRELSKSVTDKAYSWYANLAPCLVLSWEDMVKQFYSKFFYVEDRLMTVQLMKVTKRPSKDLNAYVHRFRELLVDDQEPISADRLAKTIRAFG
ncbi:hypothetical protein RHSIM_Rhsim09G0043700 [Rhododendron simsii]|uniref:PDZ domain-containing protein n=1 Tax=Rhododendron simsii TaxID=118357 RepID=A0A834GEZ8_RHOSS|nr:hypothetical protein RHSIM_Rhsim09G0043700 [Rhododendron simsii]